MTHLTHALIALALATGCDGGAPPPAMTSDSGAPLDLVRDDLAVIPDITDGSIRIDVPEGVIPPGGDAMNCFYTEPFEEDVWVSAAEEYQGENGHHLLVFRPIMPKPPGIVEDCRDPAVMATFLPSIFANNFAGGALPDGYAVFIPAGTQLVIQQHYVNVTTGPLRVRDAFIMRTVDASEVEVPLSFYALTDVKFEIAPRAEETVQFECQPNEDGMQMVMFGPHMHEWGTTTRLDLSRDGGESWELLHGVDDWEASYRDLPPVLRRFDSPLVLNESDRVRVSCTFENDLAEPLKFPQEMCAFFGYFISPTENTHWICTAE
jgi:hypothetical protein